MNNSKVVIRVIEKGDLPGDYDKIFYVENVNVDFNGKLNVGLTGDIWKSMKLNRYYKDVTMNTNINNFIEFVKSSFTPRKKYNIELIEIKLEY
jgi:hypothetical protein